MDNGYISIYTHSIYVYRDALTVRYTQNSDNSNCCSWDVVDTGQSHRPIRARFFALARHGESPSGPAGAG